MAKVQLNGMSYGDIKYKHGNSVDDVKEVWYIDGNGNPVIIWPNQYWADNIVIKEGSYDIDYTLSNGEPVYTKNGVTLNALQPNTDYIITGTIKRGDGSTELDIDNCYFNHITNTSINDVWFDGIGTVTDPNIINPFTGEATVYTVYRANDVISSSVDAEIVVAYAIPESSSAGLTFLGYGAGSSSFQNVTPIILRRIPIAGEILFNDSNGNAIDSSSIQMEVGDTIDVYPKVHKYSGADSTYHTYTNDTGTWSYDNTLYSVTQNGSYYTIEVLRTLQSDDDPKLTFTSASVRDFNLPDDPYLTGDLRLPIKDNTTIDIKFGGNSTTVGNQSGLNPIYQDVEVSLLVNDSYVSNFTVTSGNTSVVEVDGHTLIRTGTDGSSCTITVTYNGTDYERVVTISGNVEIYARMVDVTSGQEPSEVTAYNVANNPTFSITEVQKPKLIQFFGGSSSLTPRNVELDYQAPSGTSVGWDDGLSIFVQNNLNTYFNVSVYLDSAKQNLVGTIRININAS